MTDGQVQQATRDSIHAIMMIRAYRARGHLYANLDPLATAVASTAATTAELDPTSYGFSEADYGRKIFIDHVLGLDFATIPEMLEILRRTYCQTLGVEFLHISDAAEKAWIQERIEGPDKGIAFTPEGKKAIFNKLVEAEGFEKFIDVKYTGTKRFRPGWRRDADAGAGADHQARRQARRAGDRRRWAWPIAAASTLLGRQRASAKPHRVIFHEFKGGSASPDRRRGLYGRREVSPRRFVGS